MRDRNLVKMLWIGVVIALAFAAAVTSQLHSGKADSEAKKAACAQRKGSYADAAMRPLDGVKSRDQTSEAEQRKQNALQHDALIDAAAACTAASITSDGIDSFYAVVMRTLPAVFGILAILVAGFRYDADRRQMLGGRQVRLEFTAHPKTGVGAWSIRNLSGGTQTIEAFHVLAFPPGGVTSSTFAGLARLNESKIVHPEGAIVLESTCRGNDLLVAALARDIDGNPVTCWARFRTDGRRQREKSEEGRLF